MSWFKNAVHKAEDVAKHVGDAVGDAAKGGFQKLKSATLAPQRAIFAALVKLNALGIASALKDRKTNEPAAYDKTKKTWYKLGGNRTKFDKWVEKGSKKKPFGVKKSSSFVGEEYSNADGDVKTVVGALNATATAICAVPPMTPSLPFVAGSAAVTQVMVSAMGTKGIKQPASQDELNKEAASAQIPSIEDEDTFLWMPKKTGIIVTVVAGVSILGLTTWLILKD